MVWNKVRPSIVDWLPEYSWKKSLGKDIIAGLTIGVLLLPQGLACAALAGVPPVYGIYTGFPSILYTLFGPSHHAAIGPMSLVSLLLASGLSSMDPALTGTDYVGAVMAVTFLTGCLMLLMGVLNLGFIVRFISRPVLGGFASASAVLTIAATCKDLLGTSIPRAQVIHDHVANIISALPQSHWPTIVTTVVSMLVLVLWGRTRWSRRAPGPLVLMIVAIIVFVSWMKATGDDGRRYLPSRGVYANGAGIQLIGQVPNQFPAPSFPPLSRLPIAQLLATVVTVAFVGFVESITVAKMYALKHRYEVSASTELLALGVCNTVGSLFSSFVVMGAFGRSAVNDASGARSQVSQAVSTIVVILLLLFVTPALYYLPTPALAAIIVVAIFKLIDVKMAKRLWRVNKGDLLIMVAAFTATLFLGVLLGVLVALAVNIVLFLALTTQPIVEELGRVEGTVIYRHVGMVGVTPIPDVKIIKFLAPLFYANCSVLKDRIASELLHRSALPPKFRWKAMILCFASVSSVDTTAMEALEEVTSMCHMAGVPLLIATANALVEASLETAGIVVALGGHRFMHRRVHEAVRAVLLGRLPRLPAVAAAGPVQEGHERDIGASMSPFAPPSDGHGIPSWCPRRLRWPWHRMSSPHPASPSPPTTAATGATQADPAAGVHVASSTVGDAL